MPIAGLTAAATIGAAGIGYASSRSASRTAADASRDANNANIAEAERTRAANLALAQPSINAGRVAQDHLMALLGLGGDAAASGQAFQDFLGSSGYQFQQDEGTRAIASSQATHGMLQSGTTLKAIQDRGQQTARTWLDRYLDRLDGISGRGTQGAAIAAGANTSFQNVVTQSNSSTADATGNAALANAGAFNSLLGNIVTAGSYALGQSSYGGANKATTPTTIPKISAPGSATPSGSAFPYTPSWART